MKLIIIVLMLFLSGITMAQENTLVDLDISSVKGYGAVVTKYSSLNNYGALTVGGRGGWIFNNTFLIGAGIYGLASNVPVDVFDSNTLLTRSDKLHFMYGGVEVEYVFSPKNLVHYSIYTLVGLGSISSHTNSQEYPDGYYDHSHMNNPFLVLEPAFNVTLNIANFFHVSLGVGYLITSGADYQTVGDGSLSGLTGNFTIQFNGTK